MDFEFDPEKSELNARKHGINFIDAQSMWDGRMTVTLKSSHAGNDAERYMVLGIIDGKHWTAIITFRGEYIRLISVRRSRKNEEDYYDKFTN